MMDNTREREEENEQEIIYASTYIYREKPSVLLILVRQARRERDRFVYHHYWFVRRINGSILVSRALLLLYRHISGKGLEDQYGIRTIADWLEEVLAKKRLYIYMPSRDASFSREKKALRNTSDEKIKIQLLPKATTMRSSRSFKERSCHLHCTWSVYPH